MGRVLQASPCPIALQPTRSLDSAAYVVAPLQALAYCRLEMAAPEDALRRVRACQPSWINSFYCISEAVSLRESCIRENRPCSLSGGRRPARKRASSDPTSINTSTMITSSNSLFRERDAQSSPQRSTSRHVRLRAFPRTNRTLTTANIPNRSATSSTTEPLICAPWPPWRCSFPGASPGAHTDAASPDYTVRPPALLLPAKNAAAHCLAY